jgi:hypothetical protein
MTALDFVFGCLSHHKPINLKPNKPKSCLSQFDPHSYEQDFYIGLFKMKAMDLSSGNLGRIKKPKMFLSQFGRTATYRIFISASLGRQRWTLYVAV